MGKCGGHELNYVSDVDVIFVYEPVEDAAEGADEAARAAATQLASAPDAGLLRPHRRGHHLAGRRRAAPEGKAGPLVRTLASHRGYYERWAKTWEFQALLKARPVAGDLALGQEYVAMVAPMVWAAAERDGFVGDVQAMRRRVVEHIPAQEAERQLKLGSGGLRDVEFAVQLLQLVHGRADERSASDHAERARGADARRLRRPRGRRGSCTRPTRSCAPSSTGSSSTSCAAPTSYPTTRPRCAGSAARIGYLKDPVALDDAWQHHRREVRRLHEKLFYRPLLERGRPDPRRRGRGSPEAAAAAGRARLRRPGPRCATSRR